MTHPMTHWTLDPRLERDTLLIHADRDWQTRLMNDSRWPWLIVVPLAKDAADIEDLPEKHHAGLMAHLCDLSIALKKTGACTSTNVATIGNVVTQMHWHVVGRKEGDPNWPAPVWGFETPVPYDKAEADAFIARLRAAHQFQF